MTNGKDFAEWAADYGFTDEQTDVHQYTLRVARDAWDKALSVCADGGKDSLDAYRLKIANDCCDRLMQACTDAGCPDGVRMDDWIRANVRADGGKDSSDAALDALKRAERFIVNGTEFGYIRMPDAPDPALDTLPAIRKAIAAIAKEKK